MTLDLTRRLVKGSALNATEHDVNLDKLETAVEARSLSNDARFTDAREWTAATVDQAEAEAGSSTTRRAWTAQRVFQSIAAWWAASAAKTKLDGIATGATANSADATLLARANHTGTQAGSTVTGAYTGAGLTMATARLLGRTTASSGAAEEISVGASLSLSGGSLNLGGTPALGTPASGTLTNCTGYTFANITSKPTTRSGYGITDAAANGAITASGLTQATARLIGRTTASAGAPEEISVSADLSLSGGVLGVGASVATLTGTQTLSNKTLQEVKEVVFTITDAAAFEIDPANGPIQEVTLGANRTPAATNFESGQSVYLAINDGTAFSITWTTVGVVWIGQTPGSSGTAPTLGTTGWTHVELFKRGSTVYGSLIGYTAT